MPMIAIARKRPPIPAPVIQILPLNFLMEALTSALSGPPILERTPKTTTSSRKIMTTELSGLASEAGRLVGAAAR